MSRVKASDEITGILKGQIIKLVEIDHENIIIHTETGLKAEIWFDQFFDGQELIEENGMQVEITHKNTGGDHEKSN